MKNLIFLSLILTLVCCQINPPIVVKTFKVVATSDSNGTVTPSIMVVDSGKDATFSISPSAGYIVDSVKVDGKTNPLVSNSYTLANVSSDKKLEVTFKVKYPVGSLSYLLTLKPWYLDSIIIQQDDGRWIHYPLWGIKGEDNYIKILNIKAKHDNKLFHPIKEILCI